jgi:hypothetical protein
MHVVTVLAIVVVACSSAATPAPATGSAQPAGGSAAAIDAAVAAVDAAVVDPDAELAATVPLDAAPAPVCRVDQRLFGSACCTRYGSGERARFPGMTFLSCTGPRIGLPCRRKGDCDVACSCDAKGMLRPGDGPQGPADGTRGFVGHCASHLQVGVWMCQIDEKGLVTHLIVD